MTVCSSFTPTSLIKVLILEKGVSIFKLINRILFLSFLLKANKLLKGMTEDALYSSDKGHMTETPTDTYAVAIIAICFHT